MRCITLLTYYYVDTARPRISEHYYAIRSLDPVGRNSPDTSVMIISCLSNKRAATALPCDSGSGSHAAFSGWLMFLLPPDTLPNRAEKRFHTGPTYHTNAWIRHRSTSQIFKERAARLPAELANSISHRVLGFNAERIKVFTTGQKTHPHPWHLSRHADRHGR